MMQINEFPKSVIEKLGYYVYLLIDPKTNNVFYVGKGTGNRIFAHINDAISSPLESDKLDKIRSIHSEGLQIMHKIIRHGLTEKEAFEIEASLIDFIGISELTNIMGGHHSDNRGYMSIPEIVAQYNAPEIDIIDPVILITVNRLFRRGMNDDELYEIHEWFPVTARREEQKTRQRWRFDGVIAKDLQHYVGGSVEKYIIPGAQNPIKYINC